MSKLNFDVLNQDYIMIIGHEIRLSCYINYWHSRIVCMGKTNLDGEKKGLITHFFKLWGLTGVKELRGEIQRRGSLGGGNSMWGILFF